MKTCWSCKNCMPEHVTSTAKCQFGLRWFPNRPGDCGAFDYEPDRDEDVTIETEQP